MRRTKDRPNALVVGISTAIALQQILGSYTYIIALQQTRVYCHSSTADQRVLPQQYSAILGWVQFYYAAVYGQSMVGICYQRSARIVDGVHWMAVNTALASVSPGT